MHEFTLLITTANSPPFGVPYLRLTDITARVLFAKAAIYFWVAQGVKKIVIADATNVNLFNVDEVGQLNAIGVTIEQLCYQQNNGDVLIRGKGYAEGELIKFALTNSKLMQESNSFFKCTGKIYCSNFHSVYQAISAANISNIFWRYLDFSRPNLEWVDTRFFYVQKNHFIDVLYPSYAACDDRYSAIEYDLTGALDSRLQKTTSIRPILCGVSGGTAEFRSDLSLGQLDLAFPCWANAGMS